MSLEIVKELDNVQEERQDDEEEETKEEAEEVLEREDEHGRGRCLLIFVY